VRLSPERRSVLFEELVFVPGNPNAMSPAEHARLVAAIREAGSVLQPILVRPSDEAAGPWARRLEVVDGEHRAKAAHEAGVREIDAVVALGMTAGEARALRVGMNKLRGSLDLGLVAAEVRLLAAGASLSPEVIAVVGFDRAELDAVLAATEPRPDELLGSADGPGEEERGGTPGKREAAATLTVKFAHVEDRDRVRAALAAVDADPARALLSLLHEQKTKKGKRRGAG
jgi:ParB-like chromosome segregation protein Spo0J